MLSTAGEQLVKARKHLRNAEDVEWDEPTPENARIVYFWTRQVSDMSAMNGDTIIPLF